MANGSEASGYDAEFVAQLYRIFLGREPDPIGYEHHLSALRTGVPPHDLVESFLRSEEFSAQRDRPVIPSIQLPDLKPSYADYYERDLYLASDDDRINLMDKLISQNHYYDNFGVWSSVIDNDKLNMAELVIATGAQCCLEVGCFNGPILSVLQERGVEVTGVDVSHLAFLIAFPNIRRNLLYGDILSAKLDGKFQCILLLDVMEHLNPLHLSRHIERLRELLHPNGLIIINSPMFGADRTFGTVFKQDLQQWRDVGDAAFFRHWPCDPKGWPMHGHMVWASPNWWTRQFESCHLVRQNEIEQVIQTALSEFFVRAPARKSMAVFSHRDAPIHVDRICQEIKERHWLS